MTTPFQGTPTNLFSPTQIPGCQLWLDAADTSTSSMVLSGQTISTWKDKSGNGNATTTSVGPVPLVRNGINGLSVAQVSPGRYFYMDPLTNPANTTTVTAFAVSSMFNGVGTFGRLLSFGKLSDGTNNFDYSTVPNFIFCRDNLNQAVSIYRNNSFITTSITYTVPFLMEAVFDATTCTGFLNGTQFNTFASSGTFSFNRLGIGVNIDTKTDPGDVYSGNIGEIIIFYSALTTSQRQQVEGYLAWKWGFVANLPANHPYKTTPLLSSFPFPAAITPSINTVRSLPYTINLAVFRPTQISGCTLWLDPTDLTTFTFNGTGLTQWRDKSTTGAIFTGSGTPPTLSATTYNGNKPVSFSGSSYFQSTTFPFTTSSRTTFFVYDETTEQNNVGVLSFASSGTDYNQLNTMVYETGFKSLSQYLQLVQIYALQIQTSSIGFALYSDTFGSTVETAYVNGSQTATTTSGAAFTNSTGLVIGARMVTGSISNYLIGVIGEIILYNRPLSIPERQQVEGYLAWKWGLVASLPTGHPYKRPPIAPFPYAVSVGTQKVFNPLSITGCQLWLDAKDTSTIVGANPITTWTDKSGNGRNTSTLFRAPTFSNGAVRFNNQGLSVNLSASTNIESGFVIAGMTNYSQANTLLGSGNGEGGRQFRIATAQIQTIKQNISPVLAAGGTIPANTTLLAEYVNNGSLLTHYWNGGFYASGSAVAYDAGRTTSIGQRFGDIASEGFNGYIQEILIYNTPLTTFQRQQVEGYLAWKWNLQSALPANHPYKVFPPK
jgi:hypothetical protein